jgi:hypothetical protein
MERPAEFPDKTFDACSCARILRLIGWFQLFKRRRALDRGRSASREIFRATPSFVSWISIELKKIKINN